MNASSLAQHVWIRRIEKAYLYEKVGFGIAVVVCLSQELRLFISKSEVGSNREEHCYANKEVIKGTHGFSFRLVSVSEAFVTLDITIEQSITRNSPISWVGRCYKFGPAYTLVLAGFLVLACSNIEKALSRKIELRAWG